MAENGFLRSSWKVITMASLSLGLIVGGCSGDDDDSSGDDDSAASPTPVPAFNGTLEITAPTEGSDLALNFDTTSAAITYDLAYFTLKPEGTCEGSRDCGRVLLNIDGDACNKDGNSYNSYSSGGTTITAYFGACAEPLGSHTVTLTLIYDDGRETGVTDSVTVNTTLPAPVAQITSPNPTNSDFRVPDDGLVAVTVAPQNILLAAPGSCGNQPNCGHIYVQIDGDDGNAPGKAYNQLIDSPSTEEDGSITVNADLSYLSEQTGPHTISISVRNDDGTEYVVPGTTTPVGDTVDIAVSSPDDPWITTTGPVGVDPNGEPAVAQVITDPDGYRSVAINFTVENFTLSNNCAADGLDAPECGHVHVLIDSDNVQHPEIGNAPGLDYNNHDDGGSEDDEGNYSVNAHMYWIGYNGGTIVGNHTFRLVLYGDDEEPIEASGVNFSDTIVVNTQVNEEVIYTNILAPRSDDNNVKFTDPNAKTLDIPFFINVPKDLDVEFALPDSCTPGSKKECLHFRLFLYDADGSINGGTYNAISDGGVTAGNGVITADFGAFEDNGGELYGEEIVQHLGIEVYDSDGNPYALENDDDTELVVGSWIFFSLQDPDAAPSGE